MTLRTSQWFRWVAIGVTGIALVLLGVRAAVHVMNGEAAETFTNAKGVHISWGSALAFVLVLLVAMGSAFVVRWRHLRAESSIGRDGSSGVPKDLRSNTSLERTREG